MKTPGNKNSVALKVLKRLVRIGATMTAGGVITLCVVAVLFLNNRPDLNVWHTAALDEEFTVGAPVKRFDDYLALEERLFAQLEEKVHARIRPEERRTINRFAGGSLSDPGRWPTNWNNSLELSGPDPVAGVLLLHGMSDSPYSLRRMGERLSAAGARVLGLPKLAWQSVLPEYDPFKYNSFAVNAANQAYRLTTEIQDQISERRQAGTLSQMPPIMAFQSVVDATVRAPALIEDLFDRLPENDHELVLFDINRLATDFRLVNTGSRDVMVALLDEPMLTYRLTLVTNESVNSRRVAAHQRAPESSERTVVPLNFVWPRDVYSLSHLALPFAPDDPLYGGEDAGHSPGIHLGNAVPRGENGVLRINPAALLRMHWNPFYDYIEQRVLGFMKLEN